MCKRQFVQKQKCKVHEKICEAKQLRQLKKKAASTLPENEIKVESTDYEDKSDLHAFSENTEDVDEVALVLEKTNKSIQITECTERPKREAKLEVNSDTEIDFEMIDCGGFVKQELKEEIKDVSKDPFN